MRELTEQEEDNLNSSEQRELKMCLVQLWKTRIKFCATKSKRKQDNGFTKAYIEDEYQEALTNYRIARLNVKDAQNAHLRRKKRKLDFRINCVRNQINTKMSNLIQPYNDELIVVVKLISDLQSQIYLLTNQKNELIKNINEVKTKPEVYYAAICEQEEIMKFNILLPQLLKIILSYAY